MSWIDIVWPMIGASCLTLALIYLHVWSGERSQRLHLAFVIVAASLALFAIMELLLMRAQTPLDYQAVVRWRALPVTSLVMGLISFLLLQYRAGNRALAWLAAMSRIACTAVNFLVEGNVHFRSVGELRQIAVWGGDHIAAPGPGSVASPWLFLDAVSNVLLFLFVLSVGLQLWRQQQGAWRRNGMLLCAVLAVFIALEQNWNWTGVNPVLGGLMFFSPASLFVLLGIEYVLVRAMRLARQVERDLETTRYELVQEQRRTAMAAHAAGLGTWRWDIASGRIWISDHGLDLLGYARADAGHIEALEARIHPEHRARFHQELEEASQTDGEFRGDFRTLFPDGRCGWIVIRGQVFVGQERTPLRLEGVFGDISDRKAAEDRFRAMVMAAPTAMLVADAAGRISLANAHAERLFSYPSGGLADLGIERVLAMDWPLAALAPGAGAWPAAFPMNAVREISGRRRDGGELVLRVTMNPLPMESELRVLVMITDTTENLRLLRESAQLRDELAHLSRVALLAELSGSLAHELNQPLAAILAYAQGASRFLACDPPDLEEVRHSLQSIVESDKRAGEVIRKLRALLRKEGSEFREVDINEVVGDSLRIINSDLLNRNIELVLDVDHDLPSVRADAIQMQQVLLNLIVNASDAMNERSDRRITLRTRYDAATGVLVSVTDLGCGIPGDQVEAIFEPFRTTKPEGLGLGLTVCRSIINAHDGRLWAENNSPAGATLSFCLPASETRDALA